MDDNEIDETETRLTEEELDACIGISGGIYEGLMNLTLDQGVHPSHVLAAARAMVYIADRTVVPGSRVAEEDRIYRGLLEAIRADETIDAINARFQGTN